MTSIAPWLSMSDPTTAVDFYKAAFGAVELERVDDDSGGVIVAQLSIDGADFWVQHDDDAGTVAGGGGSVRMILAVDDPDSVFERAMAAGATEVNAIYEGHGWRVGRIADPSGHHWEIGRRL
jgi:PhnB protein